MKRYLLILFILSVLAQVSFAQSVGDFQSRQSGDWTNSTTWEEWTGSSWDNTANTPTSSDGVITIGHDITLQSPNSITVDQIEYINDFSGFTGAIFIANGATMIVNDGIGDDIRLLNDFSTFALLQVEGTFRLQQGATIVDDDYGNIGLGALPASSDTFKFTDGSFYEHNYTSGGGIIPAADWQDGSTCTVIAGSSAPTISSGFYNFIWDGSAQSGINDLTGSLNNIGNNLIINSTNGQIFRFSNNTNYTLNVGSNLEINGNSRVFFAINTAPTINITGDFILASTNSSTNTITSNALQNTTFNVGGNFQKSNSSSFSMGSAAAGSTTLNLDGSFSFTGGSITRNGSGSSNLNFNGTGQINFSNTLNNAVTFNYTIGSTGNYNLIAGGFTGNGTFILSAGSLIGLQNISGISSGTVNGAIRVSGTRTFNTGSTIEYNGSVLQALGDGFPATGVNLIVDNSGGGVDMSSDITIASGRSLTLTEGTLNIGDGNLLTLNGTVATVNGGISGGSLSNLTIGGTGAFGTLGFAGTNSLNNFTINRTSTGSVTLGDDLTILGTFTQTAGDLELNGNKFTLEGDFSQASGSINSTTASIFAIQGSGTLPSPISFTGNVQKITLDRASATLNTGPSIITADSLFALSGDFSFSGTALKVADGGYVQRRNGASFSNVLSSPGSFDIEYNNSSALATGNELPVATDEINNIIKNGTGVVTLGSNITINGDLNLVNGEFNAASQSINIKGDLVLNAVPTFEDAAFTFSGSTALSGTEQPTFGDITITGAFNPGTDLAINGDLVNNGTLTAGSGTATFGGTTTISGSNGVTFNNITITGAGNLTAPSAQPLTVNGNFTNAGFFAANSGTIIFDGNSSFIGTTPDIHSIQIDGVLNAPSSLLVAGNFINNGTFNNNSGILNMTGTGGRTIGGSSALSLYNLNVNGGNVNVNNTNVTVADGITVAASTILDLDGSGSGVLTLLSTQTKDAYIAEIPASSTVSGNLTVQRAIYGQNNDRGFHIVGFPLTGVTVSDIQNEIAVTGTFTGKSTGTGFDNNPSIYAFDEDAGAALTFNERYAAFPPSNNTQTFTVGEGYYLYTYPADMPSTINGRGAVKTGNFTTTLSRTGTTDGSGWHMIANPYPAGTNWGLWAHGNVEGTTAYLYNPNTMGYEALDGTSTQIIPQGQGVFVRAISDGVSIGATESTKVTSFETFYRNENVLPRFEIILSTPEYDDKSIVILNSQATDNFEAKYDSRRLLNAFETISTVSADGEFLKVNRMAGRSAEVSCLRNLVINLEQMKSGVSYQLSFEDLTNFSGYDFELIDHYTETTMSISGDEQISFTVNDDELSKGSNRFELVFEKNQPVSTNILDVSTCANEEAVLTLPITELNTVYYAERNGEVIQTIIGNGEQLSFTIPSDSLNSGINDFELKASNSICDVITVDLFKITVDEPIRTDVLLVGSEVCSNSTFATYSINSQEGINYYLILGEDTLANVIGDGSIIESTLNTSLLNAGDNQVQVLAEKFSCGQALLDNSLMFTIDDFIIDEDINYFGSSICDADDATITIDTQEGVDYSILQNSQTIHTIIGDGQLQSYAVGSNLLQEGINNFMLQANYKDCAEIVFNNKIEIQVFPQLQISGISDIAVCRGEGIEVDLTSNSSNAEYQLFLQDSLIINTTTAQFNFIPELSGDYRLIASSENGCLSNELTFNIQLFDLESPTVLADLNVLESSVIADSYQWYKNGEIMIGQTAANITVEESGTYSVEVFNAYCNKISEEYDFDATVLSNKVIGESSISVYPNPVKDNLRIVFNENNLNQLKVTIFTTSGVKLKVFNDISSHQELDLSELISGVYLVKISDGLKEFNTRIVKQ